MVGRLGEPKLVFRANPNLVKRNSGWRRGKLDLDLHYRSQRLEQYDIVLDNFTGERQSLKC